MSYKRDWGDPDAYQDEEETCDHCGEEVESTFVIETDTGERLCELCFDDAQ